MSKAWAGGSTRAWRRVRAFVLGRDGQRCQVGPQRRARGERDVCTVVATQGHHLDGKAAGDDPNRVVASCGPCNLAEGDVTARDPEPTVRAWW